VKRRDFMKSGAVVAAGTMISTTALSADDKKRKTVEQNKFKVIDFRCRPPLTSFGGLFKMRVGMFENRPNVLANPATFGKVPDSIQALYLEIKML